MKIKSLILVLVLTFLLSLNAAAITLENHALSLEPGDEYTVLTADNLKKNEEFVKSLGYSLTSIQALFDNNGIIIFAADSNNSRQIRLTYNQTDFSKQIGSLSQLKDEDIYSISDKILGQGVEWTLTVANNMKMYCVASISSDSGGEYYTVQYFTIINGGIYNLSYSDSSAEISEVLSRAEAVVSTLKITDSEKSVTMADVDNVIVMIFIGLLILAAAGVIVYIIFTFVMDIKNKSSSDDETSVIRRRRF